MADKEQETSRGLGEKMERRYGDGEKHKHDKDHMKYRTGEKSHPHTEHGGESTSDKHVKQHHERHDSQHGEHEATKHRDHKEHTREHHKRGSE